LKKVFVKSYGCQMNVYDSQRMADVLGAGSSGKEGYSETSDMNEADLVILNTCNIREKAVDKVYSELGRVKEQKILRAASGKETHIVVAGCVAQAEGKEILRRAPVVDVVVGPQSYHHLPALLEAAKRGKGVVDNDFPVDDKFNHLPPTPAKTIRQRGVTAFITIQEGCDKFCSFCVVPYTRGMEVSRPARAIIAEARRLVEAGVREITLIGQNVNAYHGEGLDGRTWSLTRLILELANEPDIKRLRYMTSHPNDMTPELITAHKDVPQLMPFLHLPVQAGADRILEAMNRKHTADFYRRIIDDVRAARPDIALSSDFIVGFPGETEAEFEETIRMVDDIRFASAFSFKYSARPGTPAADSEDALSEALKTERLIRLQERIEYHRQAFNRSMIGREMEVMLEKPGRYDGQWACKSPYLQTVLVQSATHQPGDCVVVNITNTSTNSLFGDILDHENMAA
jgi:tRNA-2-methylthio-N6-dimethylallyladenosine synthase